MPAKTVLSQLPFTFVSVGNKARKGASDEEMEELQNALKNCEGVYRSMLMEKRSTSTEMSSKDFQFF